MMMEMKSAFLRMMVQARQMKTYVKLLHFLLKKKINDLDDKSDYNLLLKAINVTKLKNRKHGSENGV